MVGHRMVRFGNADFAIGVLAAFAAVHHGDDAREVALQRENLQVEHHLQIFLEEDGDAGRLFDHTGVFVVRLSGAFDALFDFADGVQVLVDLAAVGAAEFA